MRTLIVLFIALGLYLSAAQPSYARTTHVAQTKTGLFSNWKRRAPVKPVVRVSHRRASYHHYTHRTTPRRHYASRTTRHRAALPAPVAAVSSGATTLVRVAMSQVGTNPTGWSHQWCGKYLDSALRRSGHRGGGNLARGYASYGRPSSAQVGAIAVMPHHVGVVTAVGPGYVTLVSGNHSGRSGRRVVGMGNYAISRIIAFRMPT